MKIYEFLRKVTEIELSQVKYVFGDWDLALEEYVNKCERHRAPNVDDSFNNAITLGKLVDLYRVKRYPIPEAELEAKKQRYDTLMEYCLRGNGGHLSMFERIANGSRMEQRLNFIYEMQLMANAIQGKDVGRRKLLRNFREGKFHDSSNQIGTKACLKSSNPR